MFPAALIGATGLLGNAHDPSPTLSVLISLAFWFFVLYKMICWFKKRGAHKHA
jgi:hypothetical protein